MTPALLPRSATVAAGLVISMFVVYVLTGVGQEGLQFFHLPDDYRALLLQRPWALQLTLGLDDAFIASYLITFASLAATRWNAPRGRLLLALATALLGVTGLLDLTENLHFLVMLKAAEAGITPSLTQVEGQVLESLLKFHLSYLGLLLLGLSLPRVTRLEKALSFSLRWIQLPVGLAIALVPRAIAVPLVMVRFSFFFFALVALAVASRRPEFGSDAPG